MALILIIAIFGYRIESHPTGFNMFLDGMGLSETLP
jgi:hypothetical protein